MLDLRIAAISLMAACSSSQPAESTAPAAKPTTEIAEMPAPAAKSTHAVAVTPATATKTIVLDDIPLPPQSQFGGKLKSSGPWHATITVPVTATVETTDTSSKYDVDGDASPRISSDTWDLDIAHLVDTADVVVSKYQSSGFEIVRRDATATGYVIVLGGQGASSLEVVVGNTQLSLACHAFLHGAKPADVISTCRTLVAG